VQAILFGALPVMLADRDHAACLRALTGIAAFAYRESNRRPDAQRVELSADDAAAVKVELPPVGGADEAAILSWEEALDDTAQWRHFLDFHGAAPAANSGRAADGTPQRKVIGHGVGMIVLLDLSIIFAEAPSLRPRPAKLTDPSARRVDLYQAETPALLATLRVSSGQQARRRRRSRLG
jgi:hypothetical protein